MRSKLVCLAALLALYGSACAAPVLMDAYWRPDVPFPQYARYWSATSFLEGSDPTGPLGGVLYVHVRNATGKPWTIADAQMEGVSLTKAIAYSDQRKFRRYVYPASVYFSKLPKAQIDKLIKQGEPVWWRFAPKTLKPGECGELVVRLRHRPANSIVKLALVGKDGKHLAASISLKAVPQFQSITYTPSRDVVYLYAQHPKPGVAPKRITMDGVDVTSRATITSDSGTKVVPIILKLKTPVALASMHCFQAIYPDGSKATSAVRAFDSEFPFGMWGARPGEASEKQLAIDHLNDLATHNINIQMEMTGSAAVVEYMKTDEGQALLRKLDIRRMIYEPGTGRTKNPWGYFLTDEPDAGDSRVVGVPPKSKVGCLCQGLAKRQDELHEVDPVTPGLVNIDFTFRPHNYYVYGQMPDILASDPYYQARLGQEAGYGKTPEKLNAFKKATYIQGVTDICRTAQAPKPAAIILLCAAGRDERDGEGIFYVPPTEKRIETYYAIGAGAKGISYWWFHGLAPGLAKNDANAMAQWREIGLMGAELRTAGPLLSSACSVDFPVTAPKELWTRTLLHGNDTVILICVNDDYTCDMQGINIKPLTDVNVSVSLPSWLKAKSVFEISSRGTAEMPFGLAGGKLSLQLGAVDVTRMIVITSDASLRQKLQQRYDAKFAENVKKLIGG